MKKCKLFGLMLVMIVGFVFNCGSVWASELTREWLEGIYGIFISDDYYSFPGEIYRMDGRIAYCLEPGTHITSYNYDASENIDFLSDRDQEFVKLVSYYGYGYPGHDDVKYYLAAQELIWERLVNGSEGYWTTTQDVHGERIDVDKEKRGILWLVERPDMRKPSFDGNMLVVKKGESGQFVDSNGILSEFELVDDYDGMVRIEGNTLVVDTSFDNKDMEVQLKKKQYVHEPVLWYYKGDSQKMVSVGVKSDVSSNVEVKVNGGKLDIVKIGEDIKIDEGKYEYVDIKLDSVKFGVYADEDIVTDDGVKHYSNGDKVLTLTTGIDGTVSEYLYAGAYCVIEEESSHGNLIDKDKQCIEVKNDMTSSIKLEFKNYLPKGELIFHKLDSDTKEGISDTLIEIYTLDGQLVYAGKTDSEGKIMIDDLFVGEFYLIEKEAKEGYVKTDEKVYFEVTEDGEVVNTYLSNDKVEVPPSEEVYVPVTGKKKSSAWGFILFICLGWGVYEFKQKED